MFRNMKYFFVLLSFFINPIYAQTESLVIVDPAFPQVGDIIRIGILPVPCNPMPYENSQGLTHFYDIYDNNIILHAIALQVPLPGGIVCVPEPIAFYELGGLKEGTYSLDVWIRSHEFAIFPLPVNYDPPPPYATLVFNVTGVPQVIYTNTNTGLWLMGILLLLISYRAFSNKAI